PALQVLAPANRFSRLANLPDGHLGSVRKYTACSALRRLPAGRFIGGRGGRRQEGATEYMIGCLFADHDRRRVEVAGGDRGHDRGIDNSQTLHSDHPRFRIDDRKGIIDEPHAAGAAGMIRAFHPGADEGVDRFVLENVRARLQLRTTIGVEGGLSEDLARQTHTSSHFLPIFLRANVVEADYRLRRWLRRSQPDLTAARRTHRSDMDLERVAARRRTAIVVYRQWQEVILNVGIAYTRARADKATAFEMVGGAEPVME